MSQQELFQGGQGAKLTDFQRGYAKALFDLGQNVHQMSERMKISQNSLQNMIKSDFQYPKREQRYQKYTEEDKQEIIKISENNRNLTAESNICLSMNGIQLVRKYDYEKWNTEQFRKEQKTKPLSINIWMIISYEGVEHIKWTSSVPWINGEYYRNNILKRYIINDERLQKGSQFKGFFYQDRATSHTAKATQSYLKDNKVNVIEWPPKGADLSPIELCFSEIQRKMKSYFSEITTKQQLWDRVSEMVFEEEFNEYVKKCYDSMPKRWQQVVETQGGLTEY